MSRATRGLILAAGRGSRLGPAGQNHPKCLTTVAGDTLLAHLLHAFNSVGVSDIVVVGGYLCEQLTSPAYTLVENSDWASTSMLASIELGLSVPTERRSTIIAYGDVYLHGESLCNLPVDDWDIAVGFISSWRANWSGRYDEPLEDLESFRVGPDGQLLDIGRREDAFDAIQGQFAGLVYMSEDGQAQFLDALSTIEASSTTDLLSKMLDLNIPIGTFAVPDPWFEIDTERDLWFARNSLGEV